MNMIFFTFFKQFFNGINLRFEILHFLDGLILVVHVCFSSDRRWTWNTEPFAGTYDMEDIVWLF